MVKQMLFLCPVLVLVACQPSDRPSTVPAPTAAVGQTSTPIKQLVIEVAPVQVDCMGVAPMKCMQYREKGAADWLNYYGAIEGFEFQEGYHYTLKISEYKVDNPPADASSLRWVLDQVVERHPVTH
jgi:hypothetical protein